MKEETLHSNVEKDFDESTAIFDEAMRLLNEAVEMVKTEQKKNSILKTALKDIVKHRITNQATVEEAKQIAIDAIKQANSL